MSDNFVKSKTLHKRPNFGLNLKQPNGLAENLMSGLSDYTFDQSSVSNYDKPVRDEIVHGVRDLRSIQAKFDGRHILTTPLIGAKAKAIKSEDPIVRDQAVWSLANSPNLDITTLINSIERSPSEELKVSALLALQKVASNDTSRVLAFLDDISSDKQHVNLAEWSTLIGNEIRSCQNNSLELMEDPVSSREFVHYPDKTFDLTMPLIFRCNAITKIGGLHHHSTISPTWFKQIFGDAMACIKADTFQSNLVLEKLVENLHADGSPHYEHFPFGGTTDQIGSNLHLHNYWSQIYRPFYTSGRVERVTPSQPVIPNVPMTFARIAVTAAYDKYAVQDTAMPESVRGLFFGYGHIAPRTLMTRGLKIKAGDFQISSRLNPETQKPANTYFYGTFFGKLSDTDSEGRLTLNGKQTHCDTKGHLDYNGDGKMTKDPVRPDDWI